MTAGFLVGVSVRIDLIILLNEHVTSSSSLVLNE